MLPATDLATIIINVAGLNLSPDITAQVLGAVLAPLLRNPDPEPAPATKPRRKRRKAVKAERAERPRRKYRRRAGRPPKRGTAAAGTGRQ